MINYVFNDTDEEEYEETLMISAEDQAWDDDTLRQLKDEHNIVFMTSGDGVIPVKIEGHLVALGHEDDGTIYFHKRYGQYTMCFSKGWIPHLIADLQEALKS